MRFGQARGRAGSGRPRVGVWRVTAGGCCGRQVASTKAAWRKGGDLRQWVEHGAHTRNSSNRSRPAPRNFSAHATEPRLVCHARPLRARRRVAAASLWFALTTKGYERKITSGLFSIPILLFTIFLYRSRPRARSKRGATGPFVFVFILMDLTSFKQPVARAQDRREAAAARTTSSGVQ